MKNVFSRNRLGVLCDGLNDGVEDAVDQAIVAEGLRVVLAVEQRSVGLGGGDAGGIAHVMLERIVDIEVGIHFGGHSREAREKFGGIRDRRSS